MSSGARGGHQAAITVPQQHDSADGPTTLQIGAENTGSAPVQCFLGEYITTGM